MSADIHASMAVMGQSFMCAGAFRCGKHVSSCWGRFESSRAACQWVRSANAAFTAALACNVPSTDMERPLCSVRRLQLFTADVSEAEVETTTGDGLPSSLSVPLHLISDCGSDEVGTVCIETISHKEINVAEVD